MNPVRILHLEDDLADARIIADALRDGGLGAEVTVVGNQPEFLAALDRRFDLVLADFKLPAFDGLQALALWRARWPDQPFLFVTGFLGEERAVESLKRGATDYVLKGNLARLVPAIRRAVAEAQEHQNQEPDVGIGQFGPQQGGRQRGEDDHQAAHGGGARLGEM